MSLVSMGISLLLLLLLLIMMPNALVQSPLLGWLKTPFALMLWYKGHCNSCRHFGPSRSVFGYSNASRYA
jgi:hypothetical protein